MGWDQSPLRLKACIVLKKSCAWQWSGHRTLVALPIHLSPTGGLRPAQCGCDLSVTASVNRGAPWGTLGLAAVSSGSALWCWQKGYAGSWAAPGWHCCPLLLQSIPVSRGWGQPKHRAEARSVPAS